MTALQPTRAWNWRSAPGPVIVAIVAVIMCAWSWGKWPDPVIDFGREVYVPWQLSQGQVLYRDIVSYFNGPLSPYLHALLFRACGTSLLTLVVFSLLLIALLGGMLYVLIKTVSDAITATAAGIVFVVLFAFAQFLPTGNYNFVTPYSYELPHGITLTAAGILFLSMWTRRRKRRWLALSGAMLGLVALTKAEVFLAAAVALGAGFVAIVIIQRDRLRSTPVFLGAAIVPPLIALGLLSLAMAPGDALRGMLGAWNFVGQRELTSLPYFRELAGTDDIGASMRRILLWTSAYALLFTPVALLGFATKTRHSAVGTSVALFTFFIAIGLWRWTRVNWYEFIAPAPLLLLILAIILIVGIARRRDTNLVLPLTLVLWAGAMLAKMPLNAHIHHYGFALAMPAMLMLIVIFLGWVPRLLESRGASGWPLRATSAAMLLVAMWAYSHPMQFFFDMKTIPVASGGDRFYADPRGMAVNQVLEFLSQSGKPNDTLVMLPEGLLINYLARRTNPSGQLNFTPPAIIMYGENAMLDAFRRTPPDWIGIAGVDTAEYGPRLFGQDYARDLNAWIDSNYESVQIFRSSPSVEAFEIRLMRHKGG